MTPQSARVNTREGWYEVAFHPLPGEIYEGGWLAGAVSEDPVPSKWLIDIGLPACPSQLDAATLARMTPFAVEACVTGDITVRGMVDTCIEGPYSSSAPA